MEAVDAAHIQPYVNRSSDHVQNGIPLRKDIHALFDAGLLAISDDYEILVSPALPHHPYNKLAGRKMRLPEAAEQRPSKTALAFHRKAFKSA